MPAILIPPSPQSNAQPLQRSRSPPHESIIESIVQKVQSGAEEVTKKDIEDLDAAISNNSTNDDSIPFVDRNYIKTCASNPTTLVRYIGMVQDMLDPEYYVSKINGMNTKYREYYCLDDNDGGSEIALNHLLEERQPLVIVPIPNSTPALKAIGFDHNADEKLEGAEEELELVAENGNCSRKRSSDVLAPAKDDEGSSTDRKNNKAPSFNNSNYDQGQAENSCGWWPEGCMGSDPTHCPILAKMYYEDSEHDENQSNTVPPRLQLNDIVEVYGILSLDPLGASFEDQNKSSADIDSALDPQQQEETFFHDFLDPLALPPPSLLPRLHVLKYKALDLDEMVSISALRQKEKDVENAIKSTSEPCSLKRDEESQCERQLTIDTFAKHIFEGDEVASEALLMSLMSLAERDHRYANKPIRMPSGSTLGCGSINFILSDPESCLVLQKRLFHVLEMIMPIVANVSLTLSALNGEDASSTNLAIRSPAKNVTNRLEPSVMQLPKASGLLINQAALTEGTVNQNGQRVLGSLSKITQTHTIPYRFDGLMEIDFEADLRVIVLSSNEKAPGCGAGSKLLPCSMKMKVNLQCADAGMDTFCNIPPSTISSIRRYISICRCKPDRQQKSISLPKSMLDRAQKDFIDRRKACREQCGRIEIEETDFHRWLLLTRLEARSRIGTKKKDGRVLFSADVKDWEKALRLDDSMRNTK